MFIKDYGKWIARAQDRDKRLSCKRSILALADEHGHSVAHTAARYGTLPENFDQWSLADEDGWTVAHAAARYGHLPDNPELWGIADAHGHTAAHEGAQWAELPDGFNHWSLANKDGWTVAHEGADCLPELFDSWELADKHGWTVAHAAANLGSLPVRFDRWSIGAKYIGANRTVLEVVRDSIGRNRNLLELWENEKPLCKTDNDWGVFKQIFPSIYNKYTVEEAMLAGHADSIHDML
jgi:hypothetical protein